MRPSFLHGNVFIGNAKHTASETNAVRLPAGTLVPVCAVAIEAGRVLVRHSLPHPQCEATSANGLKGLVSGARHPRIGLGFAVQVMAACLMLISRESVG